MAIDLATGFNIGSKDVIDERQVLTLEQMKNLDESIYPDKYFAICKDNGKLYLFNADNEINDETGKFREVSGSDNIVDTDNFLKSYTELSQLGLSSDVGVWEVIQALDPGAMAHIRTNGFANASTIFPITDSGVLYIVKGNDDVYLHGTQVMWTSKQGGCAIGVIGSGSFDGWNVLSGSLSSNKKLIFNNRFTINDYTLLAKIVLPDDSIYRHNIRITCAHKINTSNYSNWTFEEDIDICKFDLHFTNPPLTAAYVDDPTIKLYGLTLYEYPFPEGTDEGIKKISKNIRLYYDKTSYTIYVYLFNNENLFEGEMGRQLIGLTVENKGDIEIAESLLSDGVWNAPWNCQCEFDDLEAPTIVKVGSDAGEEVSATTTYTSLTDLGLTADATFQDVVDTLPKGGSALLGVTEFTNYQTIFPYEEGNDQFARVHVVKGTEDGSRVYARWFRKDGVKEAIAIFNINDNTFGGWQILKNQQIYTSLNELGLTADATIDDVRDKLQVGESCCIRTDGFTNWSTLFNGIQWGYLRITKTVNGLCEMWVNDITSDNRLYYGIQSSGKFSKWQQVQTRLTYVSLTQMGLTADATIDDVISTLKEGETFIASTKVFTNYLTMFPNDSSSDQLATVRIAKNTVGRVAIEWFRKDGWGYAIGGLDGNNNLNGWRRIPVDAVTTTTINNSSTDTQIPTAKTVASQLYGGNLSSTGVNVLELGAGVWKVDSNAKAAAYTNMPVAKAGKLFVYHLQGNDGLTPYTGTYKYAMYKYISIDGDEYVRTLNSDGTVGNIVNDTGWKKIGVSNTVGLVTNSQYFKINITKNNAAWYGNLKFSYIYGKTPTEVDIAITSTIDYTITKGTNTINSITYTVDGANITIGIKCTATMYGTQTVEMPSEFGTINSLTAEEFTGTTTATLRGVNGYNVYSTTEQVVGTWIDGSTVYRTTIAYTFTDGAYQGDTSIAIGNISGCHLVVKLEGTVRVSNYDFKTIPYYRNSSNYGELTFATYSGNVLFIGSALTEGAQIFVTAEYTKR